MHEVSYIDGIQHTALAHELQCGHNPMQTEPAQRCNQGRMGTHTDGRHTSKQG